MTGVKPWKVPPDGGQSSKWGEWLPLRPARPNAQPLPLDLSNLNFVDPLFLVRLRAFLDWHAERGHDIVVERPRNAHVRNYLARMGVCDNLPEGCTFRSGHGVYVAAQRYQSKRCVLAIGDLGIGIPEHLRRQHPHLTDDGDAVAEATKQGVTGVGGPAAQHRGNGYFHVVDEMETTEIPSGLLRIWSGYGRFSLAMADGRQTMRAGGAPTTSQLRARGCVSNSQGNSR